MNRIRSMMDFQQIFNVSEDYSVALSMLDDYDHHGCPGRRDTKQLTF